MSIQKLTRIALAAVITAGTAVAQAQAPPQEVNITRTRAFDSRSDINSPTGVFAFCPDPNTGGLDRWYTNTAQGSRVNVKN